MLLLSLPDELLYAIAQEFDDLSSDCRPSRKLWVCKRLYGIVIRILYKSPVIYGYSEMFKFARALRDHPCHAASVQRLCIFTVEDEQDREDDSDANRISEDEADEEKENAMSSELVPYLENMRLPPLPHCTDLQVESSALEKPFLPVIEALR